MMTNKGVQGLKAMDKRNMEEPMLAAWLEGKEKDPLGPLGVKTPGKALQGRMRSTNPLIT